MMHCDCNCNVWSLRSLIFIGHPRQRLARAAQYHSTVPYRTVPYSRTAQHSTVYRTAHYRTTRYRTVTLGLEASPIKRTHLEDSNIQTRCNTISYASAMPCYYGLWVCQWERMRCYTHSTCTERRERYQRRGDFSKQYTPHSELLNISWSDCSPKRKKVQGSWTIECHNYLVKQESEVRCDVRHLQINCSI